MDMVEVDPKLFVTCRLCLEDMGQYQIVPKVKEEIKYCFDIDVEPFDGLPQLICRKCKTILSEYYTTKKIYVEKQVALKINRTELPLATDESQKQTVSSSQDVDCENIEHVHSKLKKGISHLASNAVSDDLDSDNSTNTRHSCKKKVKKESQKRLLWKNIYIKQFACRFCGRCYKKRINLIKHLSTHNKLLQPYRHIFKTPCTVTLDKFDNKPNITGDAKAVVYSQDKIVYNEHNTNYYIIFSLNEINKDTDLHLQNENQDESDNSLFVKRKRKRIKLLSESSNETMVIEQSSNRNIVVEKETYHESDVQNNEYIKIDDSDTNSEPAKNDLELRNKDNKQIKAKAADYKIIENIVLMCRNKYMNKSDIAENETKLKDQSAVESQLQHKVLSIGRKVINNQGFHCTGLMRYLEKRNLNLLWIPTTSMNVSKESNYVRIMTKLRECSDNDNTNLGWKSLNEFVQEKKFSNGSKEFKVTNPIISSKKSITAGGLIMESNSRPTAINDSAILYTSSVNVDSDGKSKLLNKTPVSNPKQLPKKRNDDVKQNEQVQNESQKASSVNNGDLMHINLDDVCEDMPMPIITSTESLAFRDNINETEPNQNNNIVKSDSEISIITNTNETKNSEKPLPRIKVKPVSELMPESIIKDIGQQSNSIWTLKQSQISTPFENTMQHHNTSPIYVTSVPSVYVTNTPLPQLQLVPMLQAVHIPAANVAPSSEFLNQDYVILSTVEFPNTKTNSPFNYFQNLLQIHGIILLNSNQEISQDFINLVKYKLQFVQDEKEVTLCLTLLCLENKFCIKLRDNNSRQEIYINNIPAKWQWELLKSYCRNDVINRLFQSAQTISQEVYEKTKSFTCLLKSIKLQNI